MDAAIEAARTALESAHEPFQAESEQDALAVQESAAAQFSPAGSPAPGAVTAAPPAADSADAQPTVSLPVIPAPRPELPPAGSSARARSRARRQAAAARRPPPGPGRRPTRRMRGMLVTPWFAAGAGFVIAAALALNSPHTVLTYRPKIMPCAGSGCAEPGALPTTRPNVQLKRVKPAPVIKSHSAAPGPGAGSAGPQVGFHVVGQRDGEFTAIVTIPGQQARHGWHLSFRFPGRHVTQVFGALWSPSASGDGGTAAILAPQHSGPGGGHHNPPGQHGWPGRSGSGGSGQGSGWPGSSGPASQGAAEQNSSAGQASAADGYSLGLRFLVTVQGNPVTPVGCVLNQHACHFG
jgi:hypothetical protein